MIKNKIRNTVFTLATMEIIFIGAYLHYVNLISIADMVIIFLLALILLSINLK